MQRLLTTAEDRFVPRNAPAQRPNDWYLARQAQRESSARTYSRRIPLAIVSASGTEVRDADGRTYLDCLSAAGTLALGHNHPVVINAIRSALDAELPMQTLDITTPVRDAFIEELLDSLPFTFSSRARIQFCGPTGADAVEAAMKLVKIATARTSIAAFSGAYHGMTHAALAISAGRLATKGIGGFSADVRIFPYPHAYRCPFDLGGARTSLASAAIVRSALNNPEGDVSRPAGLILELVQGEGGVIPAPLEWIREIRTITKAANVPLILDEVQTGGGRSGSMWAFESAGIIPDVLVLSKAIGGGLPLAVVVYDESLDVWEPGAHAGTFRGNQLAMAAGIATLRYLREQRLYEHAARMGKRLLRHLTELKSEYEVIGDVRGVGLMVGVEFVERQQPRLRRTKLAFEQPPPPDGVLARQVQGAMLALGVIVEVGGWDGGVLRFLPPLIITEQEIDRVATVFDLALAAVTGRRASTERR